jgi:hypothetical protein
MAKGIAKAVFGAALMIGGVAAADDITFSNGPQEPVEFNVDQNVIHPQHETGSWLDVGFLYGRVEPVPGASLSTEFVRFGPRASLNRFLYVGAEVDIGHLTGSAPAPTDLTARADASSAMTEAAASVAGGGTLAAGKALIGMHLMAGPLSGAAEFSAGVRDYMTRDALGQFGQGYFGAVYELHGRLDLWATRSLTVGALASVDLEDRNDVSLGVVVGFHFLPYDGQRR